jgi:NAD(P)-dependent dehydrogenase (short-subunit alcohol dehydrogenase family)
LVRSVKVADRQKTALVTGASQGIGAGVVETFLKCGFRVVANSRNITKTSAFPASENLAVANGDIGDPDTAAKIGEIAVSKFGGIDVLVNNAGIYFSKAFTDYTL